MNNKRPRAKRVIRELTPAERKRLELARRETEAERSDILEHGRVAKRAWLAMRRDVEQALRCLRAERDRLGLSLADVEARSGLRRSVLSRLENDSSANPTLLTLQRYAAALGMTAQTVVEKRT
jgi:hypothetical protein